MRGPFAVLWCCSLHLQILTSVQAGPTYAVPEHPVLTPLVASSVCALMATSTMELVVMVSISRMFYYQHFFL